VTNYQQRKVEATPEEKVVWGRRATDTSLRGLQVDEADGDEAWLSWQEALKQQERDAEPTQPAPLE
jgi:hypothetical protein